MRSSHRVCFLVHGLSEYQSEHLCVSPGKGSSCCTREGLPGTEIRLWGRAVPRWWLEGHSVSTLWVGDGESPG